MLNRRKRLHGRVDDSRKKEEEQEDEEDSERKWEHDDENGEKRTPREEDADASWNCAIAHIEHVKSYGPKVDHLVLDLKCHVVTRSA